MLCLFVCVLLCLTVTTYGQLFEGDSCNKGGVVGTCINAKKCEWAKDVLSHKIKKNLLQEMVCGFVGRDPVLCCPDNTGAGTEATASTPAAVATPYPETTKTTTEYIPLTYDYVTTNRDRCEPIPMNMTSAPNGQKAWDKCIEYQEKLVYPCEISVALFGGLVRSYHCNHLADSLIVGGMAAGAEEYPHMVLLGFGDDIATATWNCGGSLISDSFILTAGHCTSTNLRVTVSFALLNALTRNDVLDTSKVHKIKEIIKHPEFRPPDKYNDIALLKIETPVKLDQFTVPVCLDVGMESNYDKASATGWGALQDRGQFSDTLQKVTLTKISLAQCSDNFLSIRHLSSGLNETTQLCYGDPNNTKDTCQGDSGGPLQVKNSNVHCMYTIVGVTSFGKGCGEAGDNGIYTKVSPFVPWIESIVWA